MEQYIVNGKVFLDGSFQEKTIGVEGGCIRILPKDADLEGGAKVYDAEGKKVVPGFLDIHTHGAVGVDVNAATAEELGKIGHFRATQGTTSWLCSDTFAPPSKSASFGRIRMHPPSTPIVFS